jgi:thioredoxin 2
MKQVYVLRCNSCETLNSVPAEKAEERPLCGRCRKILEFPSRPVFVSTGTFDRDVLGWPGLVLVEFYDEWCHYCQEIAPALEKLAARRQGMLKIVKIDMQKDPMLSLRYNVKGAPSFLLFKKGDLLARLDGSPGNVDDLEKWILLSLMNK